MDGKTKQKYYVPDGMDYFVNFIWNFCIVLLAIVCTVNLMDDAPAFSFTYFTSIAFTGWLYFTIILTHFSIRRLDWKYKDKLLLHSEAHLLIPFPWGFSTETLLKNRWHRCFAYFMPLGKGGLKDSIRKEVLPEFNTKKDVWLIDRILFWGQFIFLFLGIILFSLK